MNQKLLDKITQNLNNVEETSEVIKDDFKKILKSGTKRKIAFIDGGNAEIISSPQLSVQLIRVYGCVFFEKKKISTKKAEFYALLNSKEGKTKAEIFESDISSNQSSDLFSNFFDKTIIIDADFEKTADIIRRCAELSFAASFQEDDTIVVIDGSLEKKFAEEEKYLEKLKSKNVAALAKTSKIMTEKGNSLIFAVSANSPKGKWYYPVEDKMFIVKLHEKSKYAFRFEGSENVLEFLAENSTDPVFLGYPYGLIDADRFARVSNNEKMLLRTKIKAKLGKNWRNVEISENTINAHSILDSI